MHQCCRFQSYKCELSCHPVWNLQAKFTKREPHSWDPRQRTTWSRPVTFDFNSVLLSHTVTALEYILLWWQDVSEGGAGIKWDDFLCVTITPKNYWFEEGMVLASGKNKMNHCRTSNHILWLILTISCVPTIQRKFKKSKLEFTMNSTSECFLLNNMYVHRKNLLYHCFSTHTLFYM